MAGKARCSCKPLDQAALGSGSTENVRCLCADTQLPRVPLPHDAGLRASERGRAAARGGGGYVAIDTCRLAATLSLWLHCPRTDSRKNNDVYSRGEKGGEQEAMKLSTPHRVCRSPTSDPEKAGRPVSDRCTSLSLSSSAHGRTRFQRTRLHFLAPLCPAPSSMLKNC